MGTSVAFSLFIRSRPLRGLLLPRGVVIMEFLRSVCTKSLDTAVHLDGDLDRDPDGDHQLGWAYDLSDCSMVIIEGG